jgi:hypothetical protein
MGKQLSKEEIAKAAQDLLGRKGKAASDETLYNMYKDMDLEEVQRTFAGSAEAQRAGIDGSKYGVKYVDASTLDDDGKKLVSTYQKVYGKGKKIQMSETDYRNWRENGSAELMEAEANGDVKTRMQDGRRVLEVSKDAYKKYGTNLFTGLHKNEAVLVEKGAGSDLEGVDKRWRQNPRGVDAQTLEKYEVWTKDPKAHSGALGSVVKPVFGKKAANSVDRAAGTVAALNPVNPLADEAAMIGGGTRGQQERSKRLVSGLKSLGLNDKDAANVLQYGDMTGDVVTSIGAAVGDATFFGGMPVLSSVNQAAQVAKRSQVGDEVEWDKVGRDLAISWAAAGVGYGLQEAGTAAANAPNAARTATALRVASGAWRFGGSQLATSIAQGGNTEDHLVAAGRGLVLSALPDSRGWQGGASFALSYADAKRRGLSDEDAAIGASAQAASAAVMARGKAPTIGRRVAGMKAGLAGLRQGWAGNVPDAWTADRQGVTRSMRLQQARKVLDKTPAAWKASLLPEGRPSPVENLLRGGVPVPADRTGYTDRLRPRQGAA